MEVTLFKVTFSTHLPLEGLKQWRQREPGCSTEHGPSAWRGPALAKPHSLVQRLEQSAGTGSSDSPTKPDPGTSAAHLMLHVRPSVSLPEPGATAVSRGVSSLAAPHKQGCSSSHSSPQSREAPRACPHLQGFLERPRKVEGSGAQSRHQLDTSGPATDPLPIPPRGRPGLYELLQQSGTCWSQWTQSMDQAIPPTPSTGSFLLSPHPSAHLQRLR